MGFRQVLNKEELRAIAFRIINFLEAEASNDFARLVYPEGVSYIQILDYEPGWFDIEAHAKDDTIIEPKITIKELQAELGNEDTEDQDELLQQLWSNFDLNQYTDKYPISSKTANMPKVYVEDVAS